MKPTMNSLCIAAALLLGVPAWAAPAQPAAEKAASCKAGDAAVAIPMARVAVHSDTDPTGLWNEADIRNINTPHKTAVWTGSGRLCDGSTVTVTQIVNRQCSSATVCPARVQRKTAEESKIVMQYEQICTNHQRIAVRADGRYLTACDIDFPLEH